MALRRGLELDVVILSRGRAGWPIIRIYLSYSLSMHYGRGCRSGAWPMVRQMRLSSFAFFTNASIFAMVAIDAFGACLSLPLDGWRTGGFTKGAWPP